MSFHHYHTLIRFSVQRENQLKEMLSYLPFDMRSKFDKWIRNVVKEKIELSHNNQAATSTYGSSNFGLRNLELAISNVISPLLTGVHIKGIGDVPVEVTLIDSNTKEVVKSGPEASGEVEIVVVEAEANDRRNDLKNIPVHHKEGNRPARVDKLCLKLIEGTAALPIVSFIHEKKWMKKSNIRLQARFIDDIIGIQVKEAQTEPFILKDRRIEASEKHEIPSLDDDVWRLDKVEKSGLLARSLIEAGIKTVRDFIDRLIVYPQCLDEIFEGANQAKSLEFTVEHALKCPAKLKYYSSSSDKKKEVVIRVSGEVLGLYLEDQFIFTESLSKNQKEVSKSAFEKWWNVKPVDEDQLVACYSHLLNNRSSSNPVDHALSNTELVKAFHTKTIPGGHDLDFNEISLFGSMIPDGQHQRRTRYNEIYCDLESLCTSSQIQPVPGSRWVSTETAQKIRFCKIRRMLFCVVTFTKVLGPSHANKKRRFS